MGGGGFVLIVAGDSKSPLMSRIDPLVSFGFLTSARLLLLLLSGLSHAMLLLASSSRQTKNKSSCQSQIAGSIEDLSEANYQPHSYKSIILVVESSLKM